MLDEKERVLLRRMFGFPKNIPKIVELDSSAWRFYVDFGHFEFLLNNLNSDQVNEIRLHLGICKEEISSLLNFNP